MPILPIPTPLRGPVAAQREHRGGRLNRLFPAIALLLLAGVQAPLGAQAPAGPQASFGADEDRDGIPDAADVCSGTAAGARVDAWGCPEATPDNAPVGVVLFGGLALGLGAVALWIWRARAEARADADLPPLVVPVTGRVPADANPALAALFPAPPPVERPVASGSYPGRPTPSPPAPSPPAPSPPVPAVPTPTWPVPEPEAPFGYAAPPAGPPAAYNGADLTADGTLQLLPGRFEVAAGPTPLPDLRFVRGPGRVTEVTIGRQAGRPPEHIQLLAPTVSRRHARLRYEDGRWAIANLSQTNPLVVNGLPHAVESAPHPLLEGDRVEVGEFVLVFREK